MGPVRWSVDDLVDALVAPGEPAPAGELIVLHGSDGAPPPTGWGGGAGTGPRTSGGDAHGAALERLATTPCVVVAAPGWVPGASDADLVDLAVADDGELDEVVATVAAAPVAASAFAVHLRAAARREVLDGLVAESALYSALQGGPEHHRWRAATPPRRRHDDDGPRVRVERDDDVLTVTLQRPRARNALDRRMRDELLEALAVAEADPDLRVVLRGDGPAFCAGGDLDEFGTAPDPATAHLVRLRRSIGAVLHRLAARTTVEVHGPCAGSGVELAAFAGRVVARPGTTVALPELRLGLIPGAGGTVSLPRRIGRHRTAWLALTGRGVDAEAARAWNLVDEIVDPGGPAS